MPFVYDVGTRVAKGAAFGFVVGLIFFKRSTPRRFCFYYGAGIGLGMSYNQMLELWSKIRG